VGELLRSDDDLWKTIENEMKNEAITPPTFKTSKKGSKKKELIFEDDRNLTGR